MRWRICPFAWRLKGWEVKGSGEGRGDGEGRGGYEKAIGIEEEERKALREKVVLDWEHTEWRLVRAEEVEDMQTVAHLGRTVRVLFGGGEES